MSIHMFLGSRNLKMTSVFYFDHLEVSFWPPWPLRGQNFNMFKYILIEPWNSKMALAFHFDISEVTFDHPDLWEVKFQNFFIMSFLIYVHWVKEFEYGMSFPFWLPLGHFLTIMTSERSKWYNALFMSMFLNTK